LFALYLTIVLAVLTFAMPPFQKADEPAHYHRAVSLTNLDFVCDKDEVGTYSYEMKRRYSELPVLLHVWDVWINKNVRFNWDWLDIDFSAASLDEPGRIYGYCDLPILGYLPSATGILIGKPFENPLYGFYLGRVMGVVFFILALLVALRLTPDPYKLPLYLYAALPNVLHQAGAISYDQVQLALYPLIYALIAKFAVEGRMIKRGELLAFAALLIWIVNVRLLTYTPLLVLFFAVRPAYIAETAGRYWRTVAGFFAVAVAVTALFVLMFVPRVGETSGPDQAHPDEQIDFILSNPDEFAAAVYEALVNGEYLLRQVVSVFGWTDVPLPYLAYYAIFVMAGLIVYRTVDRAEAHMGGWQIAALLGAVALTISLLFVSLYAVWSPVGADRVDGLQGRYFVGLVPLAILGLSQLASLVGKRRFAQVAVLLGIVMLIANIIYSVEQRYYG
jgi:uncharacterized membrane protein